MAYDHDDLGRMIEAADSLGAVFGMRYDALGRLVEETGNQGDGQGYGTMSYQYDLAGRRTVQQWGTGGDVYVQYDYLATGEMWKVRENGATAGVGVLATYGYDDLGRRTTLARGNGTLTNWGYGGTPWLAELSHYFGDTGQNVTRTFTRSAAGEIRTATGSNDLYAYRGHKAASRSYAANALNQYGAATGWSFGYDGRGNLTSSTPESGSATSYGYTADNLLTASSGGSFVYDPLDRLYRQQASATVLRYAGDMLATELAENGLVRRRYVAGASADEPLVWYEGAGTADRRWFYADERGSVVAVANAAGTATTMPVWPIEGTAPITARWST